MSEGTERGNEVVVALAAARDPARLRAVLHQHVARLNQPDLYDAIKTEADRHWMVDPHLSLHLAEAMVQAGELGGFPQGRALGLLARGNALVYLGRFGEAVAALDASGAVLRQLGDEVGWARTRLAWIVATHRLGAGPTVFATVDEARAILAARREWRHLAWLDTNTAYVAHELGRVQEAERLLAAAQEGFARLGPELAGQVAVVQANRGILHTYLGNFAEALDLHERARRTASERGEAITALRQEQNIGFVYAAQGRYTQALQRYRVAYDGFRQAKLETSAGWVTLNMLECQLGLNRFQEALALAAETVAIFTRHAAPAEAAKARVLAARAHAGLGDEATALDCLDEASTAFAAAGLAAQEALAALQRGTLLLDGGEWETAQAAVATARRIYAEQGNALRRAEADLLHARAALAGGAVGEAAVLAGVIVRQAGELDHPELAAGAQHLRVRQTEVGHLSSNCFSTSTIRPSASSSATNTWPHCGQRGKSTGKALPK